MKVQPGTPPSSEKEELLILPEYEVQKLENDVRMHIRVEQ